MSATATPPQLWAILEPLARDLEATRIRVPNPSVRVTDAARTSLIDDIRRYFAARLNAPGAPLVIAVTGPSGVGVSTVVNSLAGTEVSPVGVLRPTTQTPIVWTPATARGRWWEDLQSRFGVPDTAVVTGGADGTEHDWVLVDVPAGIGPQEALDLAALADVCVYVNSPSRYADAEAAALAIGLFERGVPTWYVMNRIPADPALRFEMLEAYAGLLHSWNLIDLPSPGAIDTVEHHADRVAGDSGLVRLRSFLAGVDEAASRSQILTDALSARLAAVSVRAEEVSESIEDDRDALMELAGTAYDAYVDQSDRLGSDLASGRFAGLTRHSSWPEAAVDLTGILTRRAGLAAQAATEMWMSMQAGAAVLRDGGGSLRRHGEHAAFEAQGLLEAWFAEIGEVAGAARGRGRSSERSRAKLAGLLWPLVVDPQRVAPRALTRRIGSGLEEVVVEARTRLAATMTAVLQRDADRFENFLGPPPDVARLGRILTAASMLGTIKPVDLDPAPFSDGGGAGAGPRSEGAIPPVESSALPSHGVVPADEGEFEAAPATASPAHEPVDMVSSQTRAGSEAAFEGVDDADVARAVPGVVAEIPDVVAEAAEAAAGDVTSASVVAEAAADAAGSVVGGDVASVASDEPVLPDEPVRSGERVLPDERVADGTVRSDERVADGTVRSGEPVLPDERVADGTVRSDERVADEAAYEGVEDDDVAEEARDA